ncbi:521_t:CDS:2, partial [Racocetra fulgida]
DIELENSPTYEKSPRKSPYKITGFSIPSKRLFERTNNANDVRKIKTMMVNVLGKIAIGDISGQKASKKEILTWKTSLAMLEAKSKLWVPVDLSEDADLCDTYIYRIITEVFRGRCLKLNQEFAIAVINMMFKPTITTTSLTDREIHSRIEARSKQINNIQPVFDEFNSLSNNTSDSTSKKLKDSSLNQFVLQQYRGASLDKLYYLILKATISNDWSFHWVENPDSIELFQFINSAIKLPPRRTLIWQAQDCSRDRVRTNDVKQKIMEIVQSIRDKNIKVASVVTDKNLDITFLSCFAHQANLCVEEIFKESQTYKETAKQAVQIAIYFRNKNHVYFAAKLRDIQMITYNKLQTLIVPEDTR